jgi:hypothetical protein
MITDMKNLLNPMLAYHRRERRKHRQHARLRRRTRSIWGNPPNGEGTGCRLDEPNALGVRARDVEELPDMAQYLVIVLAMIPGSEQPRTSWRHAVDTSRDAIYDICLYEYDRSTS